MSSDPPPLPRRNRIRRQRFEAAKSGLFTVGRDQGMIEEAQERASQWIDEHPEIEVVSIDTACGKMLTAVTVWYRLDE